MSTLTLFSIISCDLATQELDIFLRCLNACPKSPFFIVQALAYDYQHATHSSSLFHTLPTVLVDKRKLAIVVKKERYNEF